MPFVNLPALKLHYERAGEGASAALLVHGNLASARWWRPLFGRVPAGVTLLAPSLRGCGQSEAPTSGYGIAELAGDLRALVDKLGLKRFVLVGHSLGGAVATELAGQMPDRVSSLLLIAPAPTSGPVLLRQGANQLGRLMRAFDADVPAVSAMVQWSQAAGMHRRFLRRGLEDLLGHARLPPEEREAFLDDASGVPAQAIVGILSALQHWDPRPSLAAVRAPVTVLWGEADTLISREAVEATSRDFPNGRLVAWPGVGHCPQFERPEEFAALLFGLLERA